MQIVINLVKTEYELLQKQAEKSGHQNIESFIKSKLFKTTTLIQSYLNEALSRAKNKTKGGTFVVKDLFSNEEWEAFPFGQRKTLGKLFYAHVTKVTEHGLKAIEKNSSGQQQYEKK